MNLKPMPYYFIVKIDIEKQKERREKIGSLYTHFKEVHMERNLQQGSIVAIGSKAAQHFPEAIVSDILIFHHFIEGSDSEEGSLFHSESGFNFYNVTASEWNGHRNESYGIIRNGEIIPHPDFVFVSTEEGSKEVSSDNFIEKNTEQVGSLILFKNWEESREDKERRATILMNEAKHASKQKVLPNDVKIALEEKQREGEKITASLSQKQYKEYTVAFSYNAGINKIYALSMAAQLELEVMNKKYIIISTKYIAASK